MRHNHSLYAVRSKQLLGRRGSKLAPPFAARGQTLIAHAIDRRSPRPTTSPSVNRVRRSSQEQSPAEIKLKKDELSRRIKVLERENRALRQVATRPGNRNVIAVSEGSYQGHPTITFEAGGRPFTLGLRKAAVVLYCAEHVKRVDEHKAAIKDWQILRASSVGEDVEWRPDLQI